MRHRLDGQRLDDVVRELKRTAGELNASVDRAKRMGDELTREVEEAGRAHELSASLYVQLERLHRSLKLRDVVAAIGESLANLIGTEDFALFVRDEGSGRFYPLHAVGAGLAAVDFAPGEGALGETVAARQLRWGDPPALAPLLDGGGRAVGLIAVLGLLAHKGSLDRRDRTLIEVLAAHAGVALEAALCAAAGPPTWRIDRMRQLLEGDGS